MTETAIVAAMLAVLSPMAIFFGPIPISLCTLGIYLSAYILGRRGCVLATLIYVLLGAVGMPVFSGFTGGIGKILGPTGGYILGYLPLAEMTGRGVEGSEKRWLQCVWMVCATAALYIIGSLWYCVQAGQDFNTVLGLCVLPFLPGDCVKILCACWLGPTLRCRLKRARGSKT